MNQFKIVLLNLFSFCFLIFISILAARQLTVSGQKSASDFGELRYIFRQQNIYKPYERFSIRSVQFQKNGLAKIIPAKHEDPAMNLNTPLMSVVLIPFFRSIHSATLSAYVFVFFNLCCAAAGVAILMRWVGSTRQRWHYFLPILLLLWLSWSNLYNLYLGQISFFLLPILCFAFVFAVRDRWLAMTIMLSLLAALKLFFLIFVFYYLVVHRWRYLILFLGLFLLFSFLPLLHYGLQNYHDYFRLLNMHRDIILRSIAPMNGTILGVVGNVFRFMSLPPLYSAINMIQLVLVCYVLYRWVVFDRKYVYELQAFSAELRFSFLIFLALLCSPLGWLYYYVYLLVPLVVIYKIQSSVELSFRCYFFLFLALFLELFCFVGVASKGNFLASIRSSVLFLSLSCWLFCFMQIVFDLKNSSNAFERESEKISFFTIVIFYVFSGFIFTAANPHPEMYFLYQWNKETYIKQVSPSFWYFTKEITDVPRK